MYRKKVVVFRLASSVPNYIDELIGEGGDMQDRGQGGKENRLISGGWKERVDGKMCFIHSPFIMDLNCKSWNVIA